MYHKLLSDRIGGQRHLMYRVGHIPCEGPSLVIILPKLE